MARWPTVRDVENPSAPGLDGLLHDSGHRRDVVSRGLLVAGAALAHRVAADRAVRDLRADVDRERPLLERVEVLGEGLPLQLMPSASAVPGMSSTPSISSISHCSRPGATGAKPTPQLPPTTVVTPCRHDGSSSGSQVACPS